MNKLLSISMTLIAVAVLNGCGSIASKPDTRQWVEVSCSGFADWQVCNTKAARLCENGYDISGKDENLVTQRRVMKVACKP